MESKLAAVFADVASGGSVPVAQICASLGISRQSYYKYRRRYLEEGFDGLAPRSRRPVHSPNRTDPDIAERLLLMRKQLAEDGWDNGAVSIFNFLLAGGMESPPSVSTIHRVLVRAGVVVPDPKKKRQSRRRFQFPASDDCWQLDAFEYVLADGTFCVVFQLIDDHSRFLLTNLAWPGENTIGALECLLTAIRRYQVIPFMVLTDNGLAFTAARFGTQVLFEKGATALGIKLITTRPYHPQTNGKNERLHRTTRQWLTHQPVAASLDQLQQQLDRFADNYNHHRPHQALGGATPAQTHTTGLRRRPDPTSPCTGGLPAPRAVITEARTNNRGYVLGRHIPYAVTINLGVAYAHQKLTVITLNDTQQTLIFNQHRLIRTLTIDPTRHFQPKNQP